MHGQPCPVLVPHPRGRRGDAGDMVFLETIYRAFKCWPEGSRRGARAGVRSWVEQPQAPQAPGRVLHPRPPPRLPVRPHGASPPAGAEGLAGPQRLGGSEGRAPGGSLPAAVFSGCETGVPWAHFALRLSLPSQGAAVPAGEPWLWLWSWRPPHGAQAAAAASPAVPAVWARAPRTCSPGLPGGEEAGCTLGHPDPSPRSGHLLQAEVTF